MQYKFSRVSAIPMNLSPVIFLSHRNINLISTKKKIRRFTIVWISSYVDRFRGEWEYDEAIVKLHRLWNMDSCMNVCTHELTLSSLRRTFDFTLPLQRGVLVVAFPAAYSESFDRALYTQTSTSIHSLIADRTKLNPRTTAHNLLGRTFGRSSVTTLKIGRKFDQRNFGLSNARMFTQRPSY